MRIVRLVALLVISVVALAACAGNTVPAWTYAPAPSTTPAASGSGSPAASGSATASGSPEASPGASGSPAASGGGGGGGSVEITAQGIQFTTQNVTAPAGTKFTLTFKNQDNGIPHDVQIKDSAGSEVFKTDIVTGVADKSYDVGPLQAGTYSFVCTIHPNMTGTLTVQ